MNHSQRAPRQRLIVAALALATALTTAQGVLAQGIDEITPNYRETDIKAVIDAVQMATGRTFIVDPRVNAKVTLIASEPMNAEEFYLAFLQLLEVNNFVAIEAGSVTRKLISGTGLPFGRPKWAKSTGLPPLARMSRMVGTIRSIRVVSVTRLPSTGTLISTRVSTVLPARSISSRDFQPMARSFLQYFARSILCFVRGGHWVFDGGAARSSYIA